MEYIILKGGNAYLYKVWKNWMNLILLGLEIQLPMTRVTIDEFSRKLGFSNVDLFFKKSVLIHSPYLKNHWALETWLRPQFIREVNWLSSEGWEQDRTTESRVSEKERRQDSRQVGTCSWFWKKKKKMFPISCPYQRIRWLCC